MLNFLKSIFSKKKVEKEDIKNNDFIRTFFPTKSSYDNKLKSVLSNYPQELRPTAQLMANEIYTGLEKGWNTDQIAEHIIKTKVFPTAPPESIKESIKQLAGQLITPHIEVSIERNNSAKKSIQSSSKKRSSLRITPFEMKLEKLNKSEHVLDIYSLDYIGYYYSSTNDIYTITWDEEEGTFFLIKNDYIILRGQTVRPYHAHVSNAGIFALADAETNLYYVISPNGEILIQTKLYANLGGVAVSDDGSYAMGQTYKCDKEDYSERIFIYDLKNKQLETSFPRIVEGSHECKVDSVDRIIYLLYENSHRPYSILRYDFHGNLLDQDIWDKFCFQSATGYSLSMQASGMLKEIKSTNLQDYQRVIFLLQTALKKDTTDATKAYIFKHLGEVFYRCNNTTKAIVFFEEALRYNPKIGVKRLVNQLKVNLKKEREAPK